MSNRIVIIPTYNEKENIEKMIRKVFSLEEYFEVLIVDDSSPDGTGEIVKSLQKEFAGLHLLSRAGKEGLGKAYLAGFQWALDNNYEYIFEMDCDFSHNPDDLIRLYQACVDGADVAIGSRYVTGVNVVNWPMSRVMLSFFGSVYVRLISRMKIHDATAGFKCYKSKVLNSINFDKIRFKGYGFQIEMKYRTWKAGFKITEVPITFIDRTEGVSKMSKGIVKEAMMGVWKMKQL